MAGFDRYRCLRTSPGICRIYEGFDNAVSQWTRMDTRQELLHRF